jgi:hypothetical protein
MNESAVNSESAMLDQLLRDARLYRTSKEYQALLDFTNRMPHIAPFNAMLLQIQKPGLSFAAHPVDWRQRFDRTIKQDARPLLILAAFGPVSFVYDIVDTEGPDLPVDAFSFVATGPVDAMAIAQAFTRLSAQNIGCTFVDQGDRSAGSIERTARADPKVKGSKASYRVAINKNHTPATQFATLAHELAHLFLGHLGEDANLHIRERLGLDIPLREIEAESVAHLVCVRVGVESRSAPYLSALLEEDQDMPPVDVYTIMRAAGAVEQLLRQKAKRRRPAARPVQNDLFNATIDGVNHDVQ